MHGMGLTRWLVLGVTGWWLLLIGGTPPAHGHRVMVFAWVEGGTLHSESSFGGNNPVRGGTIEVYDPQENKLLTGTTDDDGRFSFPLDFPVTGDLKVMVLAGMGHTGHWTVRAAEMAPGDPPSSTAASAIDDTDATPRPAAAAVAGTVAGTVAGSGLDAATVERIVQQALDRRIGALEARMAAQQAPWRDIVAGIGYIFGLVGVATYMRHRPKRTS